MINFSSEEVREPLDNGYTVDLAKKMFDARTLGSSYVALSKLEPKSLHHCFLLLAEHFFARTSELR